MKRGRYTPGLGRYKQGLDDPTATWVGNKNRGGVGDSEGNTQPYVIYINRKYMYTKQYTFCRKYIQTKRCSLNTG